MADILEQVAEVFREVFQDDELAINRQTTAADVEGWDSMMHVTLMINIEKAFGIKFSSSEVSALKNVGELVDLVAARKK